MSNWQSFEGQAENLRNLVSQVNYIQDYLEGFKTNYENQVKKCESMDMLKNYLGPISTYKLPEYKVKVDEAKDELVDFITELQRLIGIMEKMQQEANRILTE